MRFNAILKKIRLVASKAKRAIVQDCPPELYACEICSKLDCTSEVWLNCRQRLAAAEFMKSGDRQALAELEQLRKARDHALCCELATAGSAGAEELRRGKEGSQVPTHREDAHNQGPAGNRRPAGQSDGSDTGDRDDRLLPRI